MSRHLSTQYFSNLQLKEVATPTENTDAANKAYVDAAVAGGGGGGGGSGTMTILDDGAGNISLIFSPALVTISDDGAGNISLIFA
ncbi:MAG: hypothetical protein IKQ20_09325 [Bacteroidales bacterium]|nr:hypothetical protein [Bacteroidales bacterium]